MLPINLINSIKSVMAVTQTNKGNAEGVDRLKLKLTIQRPGLFVFNLRNFNNWFRVLSVSAFFRTSPSTTISNQRKVTE